MTMPSKSTRPVIYLVVCAAPPARSIGDLIQLMQERKWAVCVVATPQAVNWIDDAALSEQTGYPVRHDYRRPEDPNSLPPADAIAVVPATFNTINKWVAGISDTFALGLLNESIGLKLPVIVAPYAKPSLAVHPAFSHSIQMLHEWGVAVLPNEIIRVKPARDIFDWSPVLEIIPDLQDPMTTPLTRAW